MSPYSTVTTCDVLPKDTRGAPGASGSFNQAAGDSPDEFGRQVLFADLTGDGTDALVVAAPGAPVTVNGIRKRDAGTVTILAIYPYWNAWSTEVTQQTTGMPGVAGVEDHFGMTLAAGDTNGDGSAELAIHSPGDTYVTTVPGDVDRPSFRESRNPARLATTGVARCGSRM